MLSISDSLKKWNVENVAFKVSDTLQKIPAPFIAYVRTNGGSFITVTKVSDEEITYQSSASRNKLLNKNLSDFAKEFSGIVITTVISNIHAGIHQL